MTKTAKTITSHDTAYEFLMWLEANPQVTKAQGWKINRSESGRVTSYGEGSIERIADVENTYKDRRVWNDWIRTFAQ